MPQVSRDKKSRHLVTCRGRLLTIDPPFDINTSFLRVLTGGKNVSLRPNIYNDSNQRSRQEVCDAHSEGSLVNSDRGDAGSPVHTAVCATGSPRSVKTWSQFFPK